VLFFFGAAAVDHRLALAAILFILPLSFIASAFIAHWSYSLPARIFYFCSTLWLGVGLTLLMAFSLAWVAWGTGHVFAGGSNPRPYGVIAVALALLYSAYGIWNAYHPRLVNCTVRIPNLPPEWQGKTIVHISDVHLGSVLGAEFLTGVVEKVNAQNPAMVLITGDLFDGSDGKLEQLVAPINRIGAPQGTYFVTGNHETYLGVQRSFVALRGTPVKILDDEMAVVKGLQVVGISYPERGHALAFAAKMAKVNGFNPAAPSILLYHSPTQIKEAKAAGINLQLSGHVHQGQLFPLGFITRLMFGKYHHGLHAEGNYTIYTSSGTGLWGPTMRTGNHPEIVVIKLESGDRSQEVESQA